MMCVTHEMGFARKVANRVIFIDVGGRILGRLRQGRTNSTTRNRQPPHQDFLSKILRAAATSRLRRPVRAGPGRPWRPRPGATAPTGDRIAFGAHSAAT